MVLILLALAIAPGLAIALFVYEKDKLDREPFHLLVKSFFLGALSVIPALGLEFLFQYAGLELSVGWLTNAWYALMVGFSEEIVKFALLLWFAYPKKDFDEPFDGITYAVMIATGFATFENIFYVVDGGLQVALIRMFTAVPAHAMFGVLMGYYVGLAKFKHERAVSSHKVAGLFAAILFHATYDFCLFMSNYPFLIGGALVSLIVGIVLALKAIRLHNQNSPFLHPVISNK